MWITTGGKVCAVISKMIKKRIICMFLISDISKPFVFFCFPGTIAMLTFQQNLVKPLSHNFSKILHPPNTYPLIFSFPLTTTISAKRLCQPKTSFPTLATSQSCSTADPNPNSKSPKSTRNRKKKTKSVTSDDDNVMDLSEGNNGNYTIPKIDLDRQASNPSEQIPYIKPQKLQVGQSSEAQPTKDAIYNQFEQTLASIRAENTDLHGKRSDLEERPKDPNSDNDGNEDSDEESELEEESKKGVVEEEDPDWPLDADVGWGIQASDYFEKHPIKNVVENGVEINWEGELDEGWVKEINCLEWESFAFHPSPLVLLVFERYKR
jgi:hypothetical protein